jgi:hypothetical protein
MTTTNLGPCGCCGCQTVECDCCGGTNLAAKEQGISSTGGFQWTVPPPDDAVTCDGTPINTIGGLGVILARLQPTGPCEWQYIFPGGCNIGGRLYCDSGTFYFDFHILGGSAGGTLRHITWKLPGFDCCNKSQGFDLFSNIVYADDVFYFIGLFPQILSQNCGCITGAAITDRTKPATVSAVPRCKYRSEELTGLAINKLLESGQTQIKTGRRYSLCMKPNFRLYGKAVCNCPDTNNKGFQCNPECDGYVAGNNSDE